MASTRRDFLRQSGCALSAAALVSSLERFSLINALAQQPSAATDYKALVCVFMFGGNDGNNTVIPYDNYSSPGGYDAVRTLSGLAIPKASLLQIKPISQGGVTFGFHPSMVEMQALFNQQRLAVLCNVGTLVQPLTRPQYQSGAVRPYQLFSHSDQQAQQQTSVSTGPSQVGWGGRVADRLKAVNGNAPLPMIISIAGTALFATGSSTRQLAIADARTNLSQVLVLSGYDTSATATARRAAFDQLRGLDNDFTLVKATSDTTSQALQTSQALGANPTLSTLFPQTSLGYQLQQVARLISLRSTLGASRQIFFCALGGFDTHNNQTSANLLGGQGNLLKQVSQAMNAFYAATVELGVASQVTTFTLSDFGRTFQPGGSGVAQVGSDHGWGNHQFIMGGAVKGGDFYGTYPTLALNGPDDTDTRGRWIPTTSVDQYAATLASWYGLSSADIPTVFPFIGRFATANLGFLM